MKKRLVYDLPIRVFHWLFSGLFISAFFIAKTVDSESAVFSYHMLAGLTIGLLILLRFFWGIFGTKHSRFADFSLNPLSLVEYFKGILSGEKRKWAGHNPASSWAAIVMMFLAIALVFTGVQMASGNKEAFEDVHELLANAFLVVAVLHVLGVVVHTLRHRDLIGLSMVDGRKQGIAVEEEISSARPFFGLLLLALTLAFTIHLANNFNPQTRILKIFGATLQLGENEQQENDEPRSEK